MKRAPDKEVASKERMISSEGKYFVIGFGNGINGFFRAVGINEFIG